MATFDPKKEHGTVHGDTDGRVFEQNGKYFGSDHEEIKDTPVAVPVKGKQVVETVKEAATATNDQVSKQT